MRKKWLVLAAVALAAALALTAGCAPRWSAGATCYAVTNFLYDAADVNGTPKMIAADGYTFLVVKAQLSYRGVSSADIKEELIFAVYDRTVPISVKYENFYNDNPGWELFDDIKRVYSRGESDDGSLFFSLPEGFNVADFDFKVMRKDYEVVYETALGSLAEEADYPASW